MTATAVVARPTPVRRAPLPWLFGGVTVLLQVAYPLVHGAVRNGLTVATVLAFAAASLTHAAVHRGAGWAAGLLAVAGGTGLVAEAVGVRTGWPFGRYSYAGTLGARVAGVPLVVPLAWAMMAYPALLIGRRLTRSRPAAVLVGGVALASWDLFLDPQMVAAGHWTWRGGGPALGGIPLSNYAGWLAVAVVLIGLLSLLPDRPGPGGLPFGLYLWTYGSSLLANLAFFGRPAVALAGGVGMGLVAVPLTVRLCR